MFCHVFPSPLGFIGIMVRHASQHGEQVRTNGVVHHVGDHLLALDDTVIRDHAASVPNVRDRPRRTSTDDDRSDATDCTQRKQFFSQRERASYHWKSERAHDGTSREPGAGAKK
jgi:hypothetical protein